MSQGDSRGRLEKRREGTCHRCGWSGKVSKVSRKRRKGLSIGRKYGRLCPDCVTDLTNSGTGGQGSSKAGHAKLKSVQDRDVA